MSGSLNKTYNCPVCKTDVSVGLSTLLRERFSPGYVTCNKCRSKLMLPLFWRAASLVLGLATGFTIIFAFKHGQVATTDNLLRAGLSIVAALAGWVLVAGCAGLLAPRLVLYR